ncbi:MAG: rhodanese-like domain-containing protein [Elusimicrobia bacterium]|nr:rhodanese-like domain-containing protein [Elusimicrobiota bacterium]
MGCGAKSDVYETVTATEATKILEDSGTFLLDVRTPGEYQSGHLANATLIPVQELEQRLADLPADKERTVLVYCRSGNRSVSAAKILGRQGYKKILNLKGGILEWTRRGLPVETTHPRNPG